MGKTLVVCLLSLGGMLIGASLDVPEAEARIPCENMGCSTNAPARCVEDEGSYSCHVNEEDNSCSHLRCSGVGEG